MVIEERKLKAREIDEATKMSAERVHNILHEHLGMEKHCARGVPHLTPSDYHLPPNFQKWLGGKKFPINKEVIDAVNKYFEGLDESAYKNGITALEHRYEKYLSLREMKTASQEDV
ncbi:uncharacterized protein LOC117173926 [Belonocnema kinseyi]|uniref:uncharacterized protein LOC117173926 n=1 Tax=Belonocnema kinseyi TaxID=2817044 RepID=UPI00143DB7F6|nr:uncharacterized protein LOC117173926 [Belonocnema kinseyi]